MLSKRAFVILALASVALSITMGMLDDESESLIHLFTAEPANLIALALYSSVFMVAGSAVALSIKSAQIGIK